MQRIMMEFERQSEIMEMKEETIGDTSTFKSLRFWLIAVTHMLVLAAVDDMMDDEDEEEETENIINQVLDEIGINLNSELVDTPSTIATSATKEAAKEPVAEAEAADRDLQERLANLRKP